MHLNTINVLPFDYAHIGQFSNLFKDYIAQSPALEPFCSYPFSAKGLEQALADIQTFDYPRDLLVSQITLQYKEVDLQLTEAMRQNLQDLNSPKTFVVVAAHQLNLFTGPLYYIYKVVSAINLAAELQRQHPDCRFVPVFWLGSEDHDFEEINHAYIQGKKLQWDSPHKGAPTGSMPLDDPSLAQTISEAQSLTAHAAYADLVAQALRHAYNPKGTLASATRYLLNLWFGAHGLLVIDGNDKALKRHFTPQLKAELWQPDYHQNIVHASQMLEDAGYHAQAYSRPINLFYCTDTKRSRIVYNDITRCFEVLDTSLSFSQIELEQLLDNHPERFSPNVVMRPLYQQTILPAIAFVGGGGEIAYWLQLRQAIQAKSAFFPVLVLRNSAMWVSQQQHAKLAKLDVPIADFFQRKDQLLTQYVRRQSTHNLSLTDEKSELEAIYNRLKQLALAIEPAQQTTVMAEMTKALNGLEQIAAKLTRAEKRNHETAVAQLTSLYEKFFPNDGLQERYDNVLPYWAQYGDAFFEILFQYLNPLDRQFLVIIAQ